MTSAIRINKSMNWTEDPFEYWSTLSNWNYQLIVRINKYSAGNPERKPVSLILRLFIIIYGLILMKHLHIHCLGHKSVVTFVIKINIVCSLMLCPKDGKSLRITMNNQRSMMFLDEHWTGFVNLVQNHVWYQMRHSIPSGTLQPFPKFFCFRLSLSIFWLLITVNQFRILVFCIVPMMSTTGSLRRIVYLMESK